MIIWNPNGFHIIDLLPDGTKFDSIYLLNNIVMSPQSGICPQRDEKARKTVVISLLYNCSVDKSKESQEFFKRNQIKNILQYLYLPDIAPNDRHLFGMLKRKLEGKTTLGEPELIEVIDEILTKVKSDELGLVFDVCIETVRRSIASNGDCIINETFSSDVAFVIIGLVALMQRFMHHHGFLTRGSEDRIGA
jgi:hypothetical protein